MTEQGAASIGYRSVQEIQVIAICNQRIDHCLIARRARHFAQQFDAIIDVGGTLTPPLPPPVKKEDGTFVPWLDQITLDDVRTFLVGLPGTVWEIYGEDEMDGRSHLPTHLVDATFLAAWIHHPHVHLIK